MTWEGLNPPYATIALDPPWTYNVRKGLPTNGYKPSTAEAHYSTMTMAEIADVDVGALAARDAYLLLWVTNPRLFGDRDRCGLGPIDLLEGWGFTYVTTITWVKTGRLGMGWHFRTQTEHALVGVRGRPKVPPEARRQNLIVAPALEHSHKPAAFYDLVEACLPAPWVELFCRQPRLGWDSWGWGFELAAAP